MVIAISGRINSGKDTVGRIIQWLTKPEIDGEYIGFQTYDEKTLEKSSPFKIKKFAGKLKQTASLLTNIPVEKFEDQEFKKTLLGPEWGTVTQTPLNSIPVFEDVQFNALMSVRELLQKLGTEAMRDGLHTNVWVNALFADYRGVYKREKQVTPVDVSFDKSKLPNWIITDLRFHNEMEAVKERDGITIRVNRPLVIGAPDYGYVTVSVNQAVKDGILAAPHSSETALDNAKFDYEIINDAGIPELIEKVRKILVSEKII